MLAENLTREELEKKSKELRDNLKDRLEQIEMIKNAPRSALNNFNRLSTEYPEDVDKMTDKELNNYYRDLKYIDSLKSSKPEEIPRLLNEWQPIQELIDKMPERNKKKMWETIDRLYETVGKTMEYKYHYMLAVAERFQKGKYASPEELAIRIEQELREATVEAYKNANIGSGSTDPYEIFRSINSSKYFNRHSKPQKRR